ncbi:MAG: tol-pal system-associated acyl-CoA thioesterase [Betaproteobacteria bacterium HGW-Betaproteobacteria-22]|nr:MAG: tol-pal system-associated acyl-CoA thioesterase [Betaproteobacteria bacterium HGW-Betaproteobacteria-22]
MDKRIEFTWPVRVYYEDTDAGGVVYHSNYLNFMERARTEWLRALGFEQTDLKDSLGIVIVVHSLSIVFKSPAYFNDLLAVHCDIAKIGKSSIEIAQKITSDAKTLVNAHVKVAFVRADTFKPVGIPEQIKQAMLAQ